MARTVTYLFEFENGTSWKYDLQFDDKHLYQAPSGGTAKSWTALEFQKCPHCPLKKENSPQCPVARNLDRVVEDSKAAVSFTRAKVTVSTAERSYVKECAAQDGLRSLFGLLMACSGCPHLDWLRPLARYHLPFASTDENLFRILSLQLVEDFLGGDDGTAKKSQHRIAERYKAVEKVNHTFKNRIRTYCQGDADKNAIAALDIFVQLFTYQMESNFSALRAQFKA